jgi:hypothetical protein
MDKTMTMTICEAQYEYKDELHEHHKHHEHEHHKLRKDGYWKGIGWARRRINMDRDMDSYMD